MHWLFLLDYYFLIAFDASSESISLLTWFSATAEKLKSSCRFSFIFIMVWRLSWYHQLLIHCKLLRHIFSVNTFTTIVLKYDLNVSVTSLSSETSLSFIIRVIFSLPPTPLEKKGFTVFQSCLLPVIFLTLKLF